MKPKKILKESRKRLKKKGYLLKEDDRKKVESYIQQVEEALAQKSKAKAKTVATQLRKKVAETMPKRPLEVVLEYVFSFGLAIIIAFTIRHFVAEPFRIPTGSMIPTLMPGDFILVNKARYGPRIPLTNIKPFGRYLPERWDIVVFTTKNIDKASQYPKNYVKRVVGLPGEKIEIRNGEIIVNGKLIKKPEIMNEQKVPFGVVQRDTRALRSEEYILKEPSGQNTYQPRERMTPLPRPAEIRNGSIFVGDNRVPIAKNSENLPLSISNDGMTVFLDGIYYFNTLEGQTCPVETWKYRINIFDLHFWRIPGTQDAVDMGPAECGYEGQTFTVPEGYYLMLGDNSLRSFDSRSWGFVPYENIKGKVLLKVWPPARWGSPK